MFMPALGAALGLVDLPGRGSGEPGHGAPGDGSNYAGGAIVLSGVKAVVETSAGKIRGFTRNGIHTFLGVPYGDSTEGAARFMPPAKPAPWTGVRSTLAWGPVCPQTAPGPGSDEELFLFAPDDGRPGEDCLRLNVWTPALKDGRKRPVMVWLHGGGFSIGSAQQEHFYDGENLSRRGDVVVVSVNHRLGALGFLNLTQVGGAKYAGSANTGMLDLVAALEWVRDNIANFGGDPGCVSIFGQSGGGGKVGCLMAMPSAKGLFHRAIVQSGSSLRVGTMEDSARLAAAVLVELGLGASRLDEIQTLPAARLVDAGAAALRKLDGAPGSPAARSQRSGWGPVVDGLFLPSHPFDPVAPSLSAHVPMIIGTVMNESSPSAFNAKLEPLTEEELKTRVADRFGGRGGRIIEAYRRAHPHAKPVELLSLISSPRTDAVTQAERKAALAAAPAYVYWFCWHTPALDGRPRALHGSEIPFVFDDAHTYGANMTGGGLEARALAARMSDAWIAFSRTGNPNHKGLPMWPAFTAGKGETMIFDDKCEVKEDPDREERQILTGV
jgi:para-nitrobenzyl esterase